MTEKAFQDYYPDKVSHCYGCGTLNDNGLKIKSYWDGDESICIYEPKDYHLAFQGYVYGGLMASIIDCHSIGTAVAYAIRDEGRSMEDEPEYGFVTGSLHVDYLNPAPTGKKLELRSEITKSTEKKVVISTVLSVEGTACARGEVIAIKLPYSLISAMI